MYEELSRLLAGELDPASEATLRARMAADPALARAWAQMSALPDLLGGLSLDAPPPALAARLDEMAMDFDDAFASVEHELMDPADETMDPDAEVLRADHPVRARALARAPATAQGREAFLDQLLGEARGAHERRPDTARVPVRSVAAPRVPAASTRRRLGVTVLVATMAMAAGLVLGLQAPSAPAPDLAAVAISEGTTTVDGTVDLRAGDVHVRVDGRARVTVTPDGFAANDRGAPRVVVVGAERTVTGTIAAASAPDEAPVAGFAEAASAHASARAGRGEQSYVATVGSGAPSPSGLPRMIVTIEVERGAAVVDPAGSAVTVEAGESRTFDPHGVEVSAPGLATATPVAPGSGMAPLDAPTGHEGKRRVVTLGGGLVRPAGETPGQFGPANQMESGLPDAYGLMGDEDRVFAALETVPGADLLDIVCAVTPCVAVFDYAGDDPAWRERLGEALSSEFGVDVSLAGSAVAVEGESVELAAAAVDGDKSDDTVAKDSTEHARKTLLGIERELAE